MVGERVTEEVEGIERDGLVTSTEEVCQALPEDRHVLAEVFDFNKLALQWSAHQIDIDLSVRSMHGNH